jgi:hypothetical protein
VPTDEELMIARHTLSMMAAPGHANPTAARSAFV